MIRKYSTIILCCLKPCFVFTKLVTLKSNNVVEQTMHGVF
ncbi:hypothetical protein WANG_1406 [Lactobacillus kefiranofaciens subsp. kefiranofaciens]|nr:hypothetical protein WANG_1406 [Lactobacillus kefiranofaciens subsp. kefiranofaciens]